MRNASQAAPSAFPDWTKREIVFDRSDGTFVAPTDGWIVYIVHDQKTIGSVSISVDGISIIHDDHYRDCDTGILPVRKGAVVQFVQIAAAAGSVHFVGV